MTVVLGVVAGFLGVTSIEEVISRPECAPAWRFAYCAQLKTRRQIKAAFQCRQYLLKMITLHMARSDAWSSAWLMSDGGRSETAFDSVCFYARSHFASQVELGQPCFSFASCQIGLKLERSVIVGGNAL